MDVLREVAPQVTISSDELQAYLYLPVPDKDNYTVEGLKRVLRENGVSYGVKQDVLEQMLHGQIYRKEMLVAEGIAGRDGTDGYFEYLFNMNLDGKPTILPDGSVDYWSIRKVETVKEGQVIANYYPAVKGIDGMTVKGTPIYRRIGREYPPLKGKGFSRSEDNRTYTADFDGKIEMHNERIMILKVYEIFGDADLSVGSIDFSGDVIIHGNVCTGFSIKAGGNLTVDGIVECANLWSGKDIVLRGGMMGESKSTVFAKGNISARFFEYTTVEAGGDIQAEVFMNCHVTCGKKITLSGRKAGIIGGSVYALHGIEAGHIGNDVEIKTEVRVGNPVDVFRDILVLEKEVEAMEETQSKIEKGLEDFSKLEEAGLIQNDDPRKAQLLRGKVQNMAMLGAKRADLHRLQQQADEGKGAKIRAFQTVYPGVTVMIDDAKHYIKVEQNHVEYRKEGGQVMWITSF